MPTLQIPPEIQDKYEGIFPLPVVKLANDLGIEVYETDELEDSQSGSIVKTGDKYIIQVNSKHPPTRKRFTIAHEIGHFIQHKEELENEHIDEGKRPIVLANRSKIPQGKNVKMEKEADAFAADLLMPVAEFKRVWDKSTSIEEVAEYFNVSQSAAAVRAGTLLKLAIF